MQSLNIYVYIINSHLCWSNLVQFSIDLTCVFFIHQEKLFKEIDTALKEKGKDILDYDNLLELKYLTACISGKGPVLPVSCHLFRCSLSCSTNSCLYRNNEEEHASGLFGKEV